MVPQPADDNTPKRPTRARRVLVIAGMILLILVSLLLGAVTFLMVTAELD
ncbi:hypothetical protein ITP53_17455 [Nonomuraea sp. K274]|uniref:Uncharacterized protein n=1 Tax=Nonomuraea cypriaca TaxID=1187855 RepID=A0A931EX80_9ACTN|nr:hypothetical protein [Nonomuraea cypriaca]MBF8187489.1 hypothetical protein [Nonomuraea cypriaca]